jgi:sigma-E factor negative regulatory protein RseA
MPEQVPNQKDAAWVALSSMADGAASADEQSHCMALWRERHELRERWHQYHLIGDVMRSQELASDAGRDAGFLLAVRSRLADEPVTLSPAIEPRRPARSWMTAVAAAAGVAAVAGVVTMLRPSAPESNSVMSRARAQEGAASVVAASVQARPAPPELRAVNGQLIRDVRLDRYLAAHRQSANGAALQMPGAVVRSVDTIVLENR